MASGYDTLSGNNYGSGKNLQNGEYYKPVNVSFLLPQFEHFFLI